MIRSTVLVLLTLVFFLTLGLSSFGANIVEANIYEEKIDTIYHLYDDGSAIVEALVTVTRQTNETFLTEFSLDLGENQVTAVTALAGEEELPSTANGSVITVTIPRDVGVKEELVLQLRFDIADIANRVGSLFEVYVPVTSTSSEITVVEQHISVIAPLSWGEVWYTSFPYERVETSENNRIVQYRIGDEVHRNPLLVVFGTEQWYTVSARYVLTNDSPERVKQHIALIPDIDNYQEIFDFTFDVEPLEIDIDVDGNWLATYTLEKNSQITINHSVKVRMIKGKARIAQDERSLIQYTIPDVYWQSNDPAILELAKQYTSPRDVYDYVVSEYSYGVERAETAGIERLGALNSLENKEHAVCMEYTDITIALLRALSVPARELNGYAYVPPDSHTFQPTIGDELHSWVEYYDTQRGWVSIDPTWGSTTGDDYFSQFDALHIVFVTHGVSSSSPLPAGSYRASGDSSRHIEVQVLDDKPQDFTRSWDWYAEFTKLQKPWWERLWSWFVQIFS